MSSGGVTLNCYDYSAASMNLYRAIVHRCGDNGGIAYRNANYSVWSFQYSVNSITGGNVDAWNNSYWCNPGFTYVSNTDQCQ